MQSAIALLARLRELGAPVETIRERADALAALPVTRDGFDGGLVRWLGQLFPTAADESIDDVAIRSLAGAAWQAPGNPVEWEGSRYRVDIAATEEARIHSIRERFSSNVLSAAATVLRIADGLPDAVSSGSVDAAVAALTETLNGTSDLGVVSWPGPPITIQSIRGVPQMAGNTLRKVRPSDRGRIERVMRSIRGAADAIAADALAALVYALAIQDPENPLMMSNELPRRHHLQPEGIGGNRVSPWDLPVERVPDRGMRYISGSLLALRVGVPELAVRRMVAARPDEEPNMSVIVARELQRTAALAAPWSVKDEDLARIDAARGKGAAMGDGVRDASSLEHFMAQAGIAGPRAGWMRWKMARGESLAGMTTLEDVVRAGGLETRVSSWGAGAPFAACLCLTLPVLSWEMQGMPRQPDAAAVNIAEPALRTAVELHQRKLPPALASGVLALLMTDLIERSALPQHSDVQGIGAAVRRLSPSMFEDYIAAVAARGPLVPVSEELRTVR
jgi:hypothetical protein